MTRRQLRRRARRYPVLTVAVVLVGLVLVANIAAHLAALVILAAAVAGGYAIGRNRRPAVRAATRSGPAPVQPSAPAATSANTRPGPPDQSARLAALTAERDQLAAEAADLRRRLEDARRSAEMAWDAAAERPPVRHAEPGDAGGKRATLLAQPLSGARPLGNAR
jgi:hypothetical protein